MPIHLEWYDVLLRLALTVAGGAALGIERSEHSRPAGLRTVLLVCLAASLAMILANRLIETGGKTPDSFVQLDMMRLPLGILTGVGFIGAGAIIRRQDLVLGVTTAATLWFASVVGLCFGAGQLVLGVAGVVLGFTTLSGLRWVEGLLPQDHRASLTVVIGAEANIGEDEISRSLAGDGYKAQLQGVRFAGGSRRREYNWDIAWTGRAGDIRLPSYLADLAQRPGVLRLSWRPAGLGNPQRADR